MNEGNYSEYKADYRETLRAQVASNKNSFIIETSENKLDNA